MRRTGHLGGAGHSTERMPAGASAHAPEAGAGPVPGRGRGAAVRGGWDVAPFGPDSCGRALGGDAGFLVSCFSKEPSLAGRGLQI